MKKTNTVIIGTLLFIICFMFISPIGVSITYVVPHLYVGGQGEGNYSRIQSAIENASEGANIFVYNGSYYENIIIDIPLRLIGENKNNTIIDGGGINSVITIISDNVSITGFTIESSGDRFPDAGIAVRSNNNLITENILIYNFYGMVLLSASSNLIADNHIVDNHQCGIYFSGATHNRLINNVVENQPFNGFGLYDFSNSNIIQGNTLIHNQLNGVNIRDSFDNTVIGNTFIENHIGLHRPPPPLNTKIEDNTYTANSITIEEEKDPILVSWMAYSILALIGFYLIKKRYL